MAHKVDPKDKMGVEPQRRVSSLRYIVLEVQSNMIQDCVCIVVLYITITECASMPDARFR